MQQRFFACVADSFTTFRNWVGLSAAMWVTATLPALELSPPEVVPALPATQNGDTNGDWELDLRDVVHLYDWLYLGGAPLAPFACGPEASPRNGDSNGDGVINLTDGIHLLSYLLLGGPAPAEISCWTGPSGGGEATQRPLSDFLATQGTFCQDVLGDGSSYRFVPPAPNFLGWTHDTDADREILFAGVDYAGLANDHFGDLFGTEFSGSVSERALPDGRAEVSVLLRARRANGWVVALDLTGDVLAQIADGPTLFGHRPEDVALGAAAALGESLIYVEFVNNAPGAPLPDLLQVVFAPAPGQELRSLRFLWRASGPLTAGFGVADGTPGHCTIQQDGV